jgi:WD40 repeat protein
VAFSPDGSQVAVACQDGAVYLLDVTTRAAPVVLRGHSDQVLAACKS